MTNYKDIKRIPIVAADVPNLAASKITSGTLDNARITLDAAEIPNLATSKITTGTMADARISAGSVTQHVTAFDDNKIINDLGQLALHQSINENKAAYSLQNVFVDTFQDDTGLATQTNVDNVSEYMASVYSGAETLFDWANDDVLLNLSNWTTTYSGFTTVLGDGNYYNRWWLLDGTDRADSTGHSAGSTSSQIEYDFGASYTWTKFILGKRLNHGDWGAGTIYSSPDNSTWTGVNFTNWTATNTGTANILTNGSYYTLSTTPSPTGQLSAMGSDGTFSWLQLGQPGYGSGSHDNSMKQLVSGFTPFDARYLRLTMNSYNSAPNNNACFSAFGWYHQPTTSNATGNFTSVNKTANSTVSSASIIVLYTDASGTNTLNTDLVAQVSANGGTNYTTVTLVAKQDFATGIKMAVANDVTISNTGTSMKYKISFANQSSGSKVCNVNGVALLY